MYVGVAGGFTNHLQLLKNIKTENPKIEVNFVDVNPTQIVYDMVLAMQFNKINKYYFQNYDRNKDVISLSDIPVISEDKLFSLSANMYNESITEYLKNELKEPKKVFIHASNILRMGYNKTDDTLYAGKYYLSPDFPSSIIDSFLKNDNILPNSVMMVVQMKIHTLGSYRILPDDILFIEKTNDSSPYKTYLYEFNLGKTIVHHFKKIEDYKQIS